MFIPRRKKNVVNPRIIDVFQVSTFKSHFNRKQDIHFRDETDLSNRENGESGGG